MPKLVMNFLFAGFCNESNLGQRQEDLERMNDGVALHSQGWGCQFGPARLQWEIFFMKCEGHPDFFV